MTTPTPVRPSSARGWRLHGAALILLGILTFAAFTSQLLWAAGLFKPTHHDPPWARPQMLVLPLLMVVAGVRDAWPAKRWDRMLVWAGALAAAEGLAMVAVLCFTESYRDLLVSTWPWTTQLERLAPRGTILANILVCELLPGLLAAGSVWLRPRVAAVLRWILLVFFWVMAAPAVALLCNAVACWDEINRRAGRR